MALIKHIFTKAIEEYSKVLTNKRVILIALIISLLAVSLNFLTPDTKQENFVQNFIIFIIMNLIIFLSVLQIKLVAKILIVETEAFRNEERSLLSSYLTLLGIGILLGI